MRLALGLLLWILQAPTSPQPLNPASIAGTVKRSDTNEPAVGVRVMLTQPPRSAPFEYNEQTPPTVNPSTTTDDRGKFAFKDLAPGAYRLLFEANGYVRQEYGQRTFPGQGMTIDVAAGQAIDHIVVTMTPAGGVSGRIRADDKDPAATVAVRLFRLGYDAWGRRTPQFAASTRTDDRGAFRLYYVTPGRYYVAAGAPQGIDSFAQHINGVRENYPFTYYPGVTDISQATVVEIRSGTEIDVELVLARQPEYRVRGRIVDARTGEPPSSVRIVLTSRSAAGSSSFQLSDESITFNSDTGAFEMRGILPGSYLLSATWGFSISVPATSTTGRGATSALAAIDAGVAYAALNVAAEDVDNLVLTIAGGGSISGRLRIEGAATQPGLERLKAQLKPTLDGAADYISNIFPPQPASINADGSFRFDNVKTGEYRVAVDGLEAGFYIKEARHGANDALNRSFHFAPAESNTLDIVIGWGAPEITGAVTSVRLEPMPGAQVVLVPDPYRDRIELFRAVTAGPDGRFTFANVVPGEYKLYAWEALEPFAYFDPSVLQRDESRAKSIRVSESANQNLEIRVISAP